MAYYQPTQKPLYQMAHPVSYASAESSGRGLMAPHLSVTSFAGLQAFRAGPRRDPLSRETHTLALAETGRSSFLHKSSAVNAYTKNTFGQGVVGTVGNWESEIISKHASRTPLMPAVGVMEHGGRYDGVVGSGAAGAAHPHLGLFGANPQMGGGGGMGHGPPPPMSPHYGRQTTGFTEEGKRQFLLSNERARRGAEQRWQRTNTIGAYVEVPMAQRPPATADGRGGYHPHAFETPMHPTMPLSTPNAPERRVHW